MTIFRAVLVPDRMVIATFRFFALAEAASWAGLLVGMYLKYVSESTEAGVHLFGPVHGTMFIAYVLAASVASRRLGWDPRATVMALVAAVPPLATVAFETWARRRGILGGSEPETPVRESV